MRLLKKRCPDIIGAGGLGASPSLKKSPKIGGFRGLIKTSSAVSLQLTLSANRENMYGDAKSDENQDDSNGKNLNRKSD